MKFNLYRVMKVFGFCTNFPQSDCVALSQQKIKQKEIVKNCLNHGILTSTQFVKRFIF